MAKLFCFLLILLILTTNAEEYTCNTKKLITCLNHLNKLADPARLVLTPGINYHLNESYILSANKRNITITSEQNADIIINRTGGEKLQLVFLNAGLVSLENLSFIEHTNSKVREFYPFLTINNSRSVDITRCQFRGILGLALEMSSTDNGDFSLRINETKFEGTGIPRHYPSQGVYVSLNDTGNVSVSVTRSNFTNFKISDLSNLTYIQRVRYRPLALEQCDNQKNKDAIKFFNVSDCNFEDNEAYVGGGLGLYTTWARNSYYNVSNCNFRNNKVINSIIQMDEKHSVEVIGSGGGIAGLFFNCDTCNLTIINCTLVDNTAMLGGGIKVGYYFKSPNLYINIYECSFRNNTASSGSGLYIESQLIRHSIPRPAWLRNLEFLNNTATGFGAGIFVAYLPLMLRGKYIHFLNNINTSFAVISSQIEVYADLIFKNNSGQRGGALFLSDNSQLLLNQSVSLYFENNRAQERGGAIYADSISLDLLYRDYGYTFYNVHCFIKHFISFNPVTPDLYTQNITFKNNSAPKGAAIYTHTLSPCSWYSNSPPYSNISLALRWKTYRYIDITGKPPDYPKLIATAVAHYTISQDNATLYKMLSDYNKPYKHHRMVSITVQPGIPIEIFFVATDQLGSHEVSIATVQADVNSRITPCNVHGDQSIFLTSSDDKSSTEKNKVALSFCGNSGEHGIVLFKSLDGLTIEKSLNVSLESCPNGMFLNKIKNTCDCYNLDSATGLVTYRKELSAHSNLYPWMKNSTENTFVQMSCPTSYCNVTQQQDYEKHHHHHCTVTVSNNSECLRYREGIGCTRCSGNRGVYSGTLGCSHCDSKRTALSTVGVILLLLIIISFLFLIRASSYLNDHIELRGKLGPYARSFIFFCQALFILYLNVTPDNPHNRHTLSSFSQFISKTGFFFSYDQCFTLGLSTSRGVVFEEYFLYLIGFVSIFLIALFFNCVISRCSSIKFKSSVLLFVLVTYSYLTYAPIAFTTLRLLSCGRLTVYNSTSGQHEATHLIWFYNATETCLGSNWDLLMTSVAILTLIFYVILLPLLYIGFALVTKQLEIRRMIPSVFKRKTTKHVRRIPPIPSTSKLQRLIENVKKLSNVYVSAFSDPHFGFWIPITMVAHLFLILIQTNGALLALTSDKQAQFLAVICFIFLYIRVSLKITKDPYVQFYDSIAIFCLCLACIFLIINDNLSTTNQPLGGVTFQSIVEYFPLVSYIFMFFSILTPPAIKYCVNKYSPATPDTDETPKEIPIGSGAHTLPAPDGETDSDELDEQAQPLIAHDALNELNDYINSTHGSPPPRHINMGNMSHSNSYSTDHSHGTGTPGIHEAFSDLDMRSLERSNVNQADD